jgi:hypothetical protein
LAGSRRAGPGRRDQLPGAVGAVERGRPPANTSHPSPTARQQLLAASTTGGSPAQPLGIRLERQDRRLGRNRSRACSTASESSRVVGRQLVDPGLGGGCPRCRPSIPWPQPAPKANTRHERGGTYAPAWQQSQGRRSSRGDPWETPPPMKSVVGAGRSSLQPPDPSAPGDNPRVEDRSCTNQHKRSKRDKRSWTGATEPAQPHQPEPTSPRQRTRRGPRRRAQAWGCAEPLQPRSGPPLQQLGRGSPGT